MILLKVGFFLGLLKFYDFGELYEDVYIYVVFVLFFCLGFGIFSFGFMIIGIDVKGY